MNDRINFRSWTGWASPLALRATPPGTVSAQPLHDTSIQTGGSIAFHLTAISE
jgi:hypothetical protein